MSKQNRVAVIGAGVTGVTTAGIAKLSAIGFGLAIG